MPQLAAASWPEPFKRSLEVETRLEGLGDAQATSRLAQQEPLSLLVTERGPENAGSTPESVWKSGDDTINGVGALSPQPRPGAPGSARLAGEAPWPTGRE